MDNKFLIPLSIVIAGALVAGAVIFSGRISTNPEAAVKNTEERAGQNTVGEMRPVTEDDYVRGSLDAPIKIVEYSDLECPFCQQFHGTMKRVRDEYPNQVAWVWRHFPIEQLHSKAPREAEAAECVGQLGGDEAFWTFVDRVYEVGPMNNKLDLDRLPEFAAHAGVSTQQFNQCLENNAAQDAVDADLEDARSAGANIQRLGTPFNVIIVGDEKIPVVGAQPFESIKKTIDRLLEEN